jgi:hypothetical protein
MTTEMTFLSPSPPRPHPPRSRMNTGTLITPTPYLRIPLQVPLVLSGFQPNDLTEESDSFGFFGLRPGLTISTI